MVSYIFGLANVIFLYHILIQIQEIGPVLYYYRKKKQGVGGVVGLKYQESWLKCYSFYTVISFLKHLSTGI